MRCILCGHIAVAEEVTYHYDEDRKDETVYCPNCLKPGVFQGETGSGSIAYSQGHNCLHLSPHDWSPAELRAIADDLEIPKHHPTADARQSARMWFEATHALLFIKQHSDDLELALEKALWRYNTSKKVSQLDEPVKTLVAENAELHSQVIKLHEDLRKQKE